MKTSDRICSMFKSNKAKRIAASKLLCIKSDETPKWLIFWFDDNSVIRFSVNS